MIKRQAKLSLEITYYLNIEVQISPQKFQSWSEIIISGKFFPLELQGCGVATTTRGLFCYRIFGDEGVLSVLGFTLSDMGYKFPIGVSEGGRVFSGGVFLQEGFVLYHLTFLKW